jgi:hypothetical protein
MANKTVYATYGTKTPMTRHIPTLYQRFVLIPSMKVAVDPSVQGKRPLRRPRHRWEDNIKIHLQKVGCGGIDWIDLAQDMDRGREPVIAVMNLRVPLNAGNSLTI